MQSVEQKFGLRGLGGGGENDEARARSLTAS